MSTVTPRELQEIERANRSARQPVVFVHGLWMLAPSWQPWRTLFEENGYTTVAPSWPDDPESVEEARQHPEVLAHQGLQQIADHFLEVIGGLDFAPAIVGHSIGGLLAQMLAGRGVATATVAIDPAPFRGVLPLPLSTLKGTFPVLRHPGNYNRAVSLTYEQFRYAFANAVSEDEARALYEMHGVASPAKPLFQAATANLNPWTEARVDSTNARRGPLLIISGEKDTIIPYAIARATFSRQKRNSAVTEFRELAGRGHSLIYDHGWREVAEVTLEFLRRFHPPVEAPVEELRPF